LFCFPLELEAKLEMMSARLAELERLQSANSSTLQQLAKFFSVDIKEFFKNKSSNIVINQTNTDNKEHSVNGIIVLLNDKETFNELVTIIKKQFGNISDT